MLTDRDIALLMNRHSLQLAEMGIANGDASDDDDDERAAA